MGTVLPLSRLKLLLKRTVRAVTEMLPDPPRSSYRSTWVTSAVKKSTVTVARRTVGRSGPDSGASEGKAAYRDLPGRPAGFKARQ